MKDTVSMCLTEAEIIKFLSLKDVSGESMKLIRRVNSHICKCEECFKVVESFQRVHDAFSKESYESDAPQKESLKESDGMKKLKE